MNQPILVGRVYVGEPVPSELRVTQSRGYIDVLITTADGQVWISQSKGTATALTAEQSDRLAELQAQAHRAAPAIAAAYATCERAHESATSTRDRIARNAIREAGK